MLLIKTKEVKIRKENLPIIRFGPNRIVTKIYQETSFFLADSLSSFPSLSSSMS